MTRTAPTNGLEIGPEDPLEPELGPLLDESYAELKASYDETHIYTASPAEMAAPDARFLVARQRQRPVGCIGRVPLDQQTAEIKRLFVTAAARRQGLGRRLIEALEFDAMGAGYRKLVLETGTEQPAAIRLYEALGYRSIPAFGAYVESPYSLCYEKRLRGDASE